MSGGESKGTPQGTAARQKEGTLWLPRTLPVFSSPSTAKRRWLRMRWWWNLPFVRWKRRMLPRKSWTRLRHISPSSARSPRLRRVRAVPQRKTRRLPRVSSSGCPLTAPCWPPKLWSMWTGLWPLRSAQRWWKFSLPRVRLAV